MLGGQAVTQTFSKSKRRGIAPAISQDPEYRLATSNNRCKSEHWNKGATSLQLVLKSISCATSLHYSTRRIKAQEIGIAHRHTTALCSSVIITSNYIRLSHPTGFQSLPPNLPWVTIKRSTHSASLNTCFQCYLRYLSVTNPVKVTLIFNSCEASCKSHSK